MTDEFTRARFRHHVESLSQDFLERLKAEHGPVIDYKDSIFYNEIVSMGEEALPYILELYDEDSIETSVLCDCFPVMVRDIVGSEVLDERFGGLEAYSKDPEKYTEHFLRECLPAI